MRKVEAVPDWVDSKYQLYQATTCSATSKRSTRQSASNSYPMANEKSSDSSSDSSESSSESEPAAQLVEDVEEEPCSSRQAVSGTKNSNKGSGQKRRTRRQSSDEYEERHVSPRVKSPKKTVPKKRSLFTEVERERIQQPLSSADMAMQLMLESTRQLRSDLDSMRREHRAVIKRVQHIEVNFGRLTNERTNERSSCDHGVDDRLAASINEALYAEDSTSAEELHRRESAESNMVPRFNRAAPVSPVGSLTWIHNTYGSKAKSIVSRLRDLRVSESKWPYLFDARYSADKAMAQRLLDARFSEDELTCFVMTRPSMTRPRDQFNQPLKGADGSLLPPLKSALPDKKEMLGGL